MECENQCNVVERRRRETFLLKNEHVYVISTTKLQVVHGTINARAFLWTIYTHICFADLIVTCGSLRAFLKNTELMLRYPLQTTRWRQR